MKKRLLVLAVFTGLIGVWQTGAFATNGDDLIGVTPNSEAMGGIGVGMPVGSVDSVFRNPAWMSVARSNKVQFGGMLFMPSVKAENNSASADSDANLFLVPEVGIVDKINDKLVFGIGAFGVSGMGTDYTSQNPDYFYNMRTTLQFMRIIPALSYQINPMISVGAGIDFAYGSLDMNATMPNDCGLVPTPQGPVFNCTSEASYGGGQSSALGIGGQLGIAFNFGNFVYAGLNYESPISMTYRHVFDFQGASMGKFSGSFQDLKLEQPQELAFGVGVAPTDKWNVGADVRWINWSNADGYKEFGWEDQWVFALGTSYKVTPKLTLRAGFNYARSPIRSNSFGTNMNPPSTSISGGQFNQYDIDLFNLYGFPAITEEAVTVGGSYQFTNTFGVSLAYEHDFQHSVTDSGQCYNGQPLTSQDPYSPCSIGAKNAEDALSVALEWRF
ncbi:MULTISPECIES: outer membrane protein transport protein [unclassified Hydrogenobaculum]|uniref:OmpP1/FadL family transporter n=1 Tax=unclassified Hydrogenobaculum TaxID=2622382 RepID=UPI0001C50744|nr:MULTISPECIES: outer membrane protein transport protein [unclassified Hydrogenobaculum]AEF18847.1 membrane protein involved in aromatic hydrocarbon degradation [Hydrogenobaculum sp. 3684]AEG46135.1 membrane protein involved in aromatic hydrocarbon degradation [Hydrogenobaculum sp. SHO]AGG14780.1 membrane protein involved in aromatic hydrocarbon degradation [Hydrogenobaculum sp. HO]AGH93077.1 long-chain fatty acid transport protein [Hydrogenobaculum sp. SN]